MCLTGREVDHLTHIIDMAEASGISYLQEVILAIYLYPLNPLYLFPAKITAFTVILLACKSILLHTGRCPSLLSCQYNRYCHLLDRETYILYVSKMSHLSQKQPSYHPYDI